MPAERRTGHIRRLARPNRAKHIWLDPTAHQTAPRSSPMQPHRYAPRNPVSTSQLGRGRGRHKHAASSQDVQFHHPDLLASPSHLSSSCQHLPPSPSHWRLSPQLPHHPYLNSHPRARYARNFPLKRLPHSQPNSPLQFLHTPLHSPVCNPTPPILFRIIPMTFTLTNRVIATKHCSMKTD
jgi:hypothetical protein